MIMSRMPPPLRWPPAVVLGGLHRPCDLLRSAGALSFPPSPISWERHLQFQRLRFG